MLYIWRRCYYQNLWSIFKKLILVVLHFHYLSNSGNALSDEGFKALMEAMIEGALPELVYINADSMFYWFL